MTSSSVRDLISIALRRPNTQSGLDVEGRGDATSDIIDGAQAIHLNEQALRLVHLNEWGGLLEVHLETSTDDILSVVAAALLASSARPMLTIIPVVAGVPVGLSWLKLQARLKRDARIDKLGNS